jgi:hypothetical protein
VATTERLAASTLGLPFAVDMTGVEVERTAEALAMTAARHWRTIRSVATT